MKNKAAKNQYSPTVGRIQKYLTMLVYSLRKGIFRNIENT